MKKPHFIKSIEIILTLFIYKIAFIPIFYGIFNLVRLNFPYVADKIHAFSFKKIEMRGDWKTAFSNTQAQIGIEQVKHIGKISEKRMNLDTIYFEGLKDVENIVVAPRRNFPLSHFPIRVKNRDKIAFREKMYKLRVECGKTLDYCLPDMELYRKYKQAFQCPVATLVSQKIVNLPNYPSLTTNQANYIVDCVKKVIRST